jgi:hypothetical protein
MKRGELNCQVFPGRKSLKWKGGMICGFEDSFYITEERDGSICSSMRDSDLDEWKRRAAARAIK